MRYEFWQRICYAFEVMLLIGAAAAFFSLPLLIAAAIWPCVPAWPGLALLAGGIAAAIPNFLLPRSIKDMTGPD